MSLREVVTGILVSGMRARCTPEQLIKIDEAANRAVEAIINSPNPALAYEAVGRKLEEAIDKQHSAADSPGKCIGCGQHLVMVRGRWVCPGAGKIL